MTFKMSGRAEYFGMNRNELAGAALDAMYAAGLKFESKESNHRTFDTIVETIYALGAHDGYEKGYRAGICDWVAYNGEPVTTQLQSDLLDALYDFQKTDAAEERRRTSWLETLHSGLPEMLDLNAIKKLSKQWKVPVDHVVLFCDISLELSQEENTYWMIPDKIAEEIRARIPSIVHTWRKDVVYRRYEKVLELSRY